MPELTIMAPSLRVAQLIDPNATRAGHIAPSTVWDVEQPETMAPAIEKFNKARSLGLRAYPSDTTRCEPGEITELREIGAIQPRYKQEGKRTVRIEDAVLKDVEIVMIGAVMGGSPKTAAKNPRNPRISAALRRHWSRMTPEAKHDLMEKMARGVRNSRFTQRSLPL